MQLTGGKQTTYDKGPMKEPNEMFSDNIVHTGSVSYSEVCLIAIVTLHMRH